MFKFLHAADIHLDSPFDGLERYAGAPEDTIAKATRRALENLTREAIENRVAFVLIAGDVYDGDWQDYGTGLFFVSKMTELGNSGIRVFLVSGNHDAASRISRDLMLPPCVHSFSTDRPETVLLNDLDVAIHGQGFERAAVTENLAAGFPATVPDRFNIGLLHTCATGLSGHERYAPCSLDDLLARDYDYWALGHIHHREVLHERPWVVFPGNIQGRHIRETGPKGCTLVEVDSGREVRGVEHRDLDVIRWSLCEVDATGSTDPYDVIDRFEEQLPALVEEGDGRPLAVRVIISGACDAHRELASDPEKWVQNVRARSMRAGVDMWIEKVSLRTSPRADAKKTGNGDGPLGELTSYLNELRNDESEMGEIASSVESFLKKLPAELRNGFDDTMKKATDQLGKELDGAHQLLVSRLLSEIEKG